LVKDIPDVRNVGFDNFLTGNSVKTITDDRDNDLEITSDSVTKISNSNYTSFVFTLKLKSPRAQVFQNLTISKSNNGDVRAFLTTYKPDAKWLRAFRMGKRNPFSGTFKNSKLTGKWKKLNINGKGNQIKELSLDCVDIIEYTYYPYKCASGQHSPGEGGCQLLGDERAGYVVLTTTQTDCTWTYTPAEPGTGGGGNPPTTPTTPEPYDPCDEVSVSSLPDEDTPVDPNEPVPLPCDIALVPTSAFKIDIHKVLTKNAAVKLGFCASAINSLVKGVEDTDYKTYFGLAPGTSVFHFDGLQNYNAIKQNWDGFTQSINTQTAANDYYKIGALTHAFQDFYAHSNYAELLIKFYGNDTHNIAFSEVLNDTSGQYNGLKAFLQTELKTGSFDLATHFLKSFGAFLQDVNYEDTHSYISKDNADTYAGDYAARLAERQTHNILSKVNQKCK